MVVGEGEAILRLILAVVLGSFIGSERELKNKPAGVRTHALVSLGSCLFTIVSLSFGTVASVDPSRVAAGIVTGIGFLGAGAIFRIEDRIAGLTTAADLWVIAAVGLAVGLGYYSLAISSAVLAYSVLFCGRFFEKSEVKKQSKKGKS